MPIEETRQKLAAISDSMCLAKWSQVTLHLHNGHNHSCHHPCLHKIDKDELKLDPSVLHNTGYKKEQRQKMLDGVRPGECEYCWKLEDSGADSDRLYKSDAPWSRHHYDEILEAGATENFNPRSVEVSFDTTCNLKCAYCSPYISSKWMEEVRQFGGYPEFNDHKHDDMIPIPAREYNPYVDAFWKWWPDLVGDLYDFRVTGGEPLLSRNFWKVMDYLDENHHPNLHFAVNTNMSVDKYIVERFAAELNNISNNVKSITVYTSIDTYGPQAEYIRYGLDIDLFQSNVRHVLETTDVSLCFMVTVNALSVFNFTRLIRYINTLKMEFGKRVLIDTPYLNHPEFLSLRMLPRQLRGGLKTALNYMEGLDFHEQQVAKFQRVIDWMDGDTPFDVDTHRRRFYNYIKEYDRRKGTYFLEIFPEMTEFWEYLENQYA